MLLCPRDDGRIFPGSQGSPAKHGTFCEDAPSVEEDRFPLWAIVEPQLRYEMFGRPLSRERLVLMVAADPLGTSNMFARGAIQRLVCLHGGTGSKVGTAIEDVDAETGDRASVASVRGRSASSWSSCWSSGQGVGPGDEPAANEPDAAPQVEEKAGDEHAPSSGRGVEPGDEPAANEPDALPQVGEEAGDEPMANGASAQQGGGAGDESAGADDLSKYLSTTKQGDVDSKEAVDNAERLKTWLRTRKRRSPRRRRHNWLNCVGKSTPMLI